MLLQPGLNIHIFSTTLDFASEILWPDKHLLCQGWTLFKAVLHHAKMKEKKQALWDHRFHRVLRFKISTPWKQRLTNETNLQKNTACKINMEPKNGGGWKMIVLSNWIIFRFHVDFPGCTLSDFPKSKKSPSWAFLGSKKLLTWRFQQTNTFQGY